uniref:Uncharacterized protein n=1 Tax=Anguilla anguilla TaxID=7936 RepID=A0A0E9V1Q9_ANGAN
MSIFTLLLCAGNYNFSYRFFDNIQ